MSIILVRNAGVAVRPWPCTARKVASRVEKAIIKSLVRLDELCLGEKERGRERERECVCV